MGHYLFQFRPLLVVEVYEQSVKLHIKTENINVKKMQFYRAHRAVEWRQGYPGPFATHCAAGKVAPQYK